jgi:hypothetical protein
MEVVHFEQDMEPHKEVQDKQGVQNISQTLEELVSVLATTTKQIGLQEEH